VRCWSNVKKSRARLERTIRACGGRGRNSGPRWVRVSFSPSSRFSPSPISSPSSCAPSIFTHFPGRSDFRRWLCHTYLSVLLPLRTPFAQSFLSVTPSTPLERLSELPDCSRRIIGLLTGEPVRLLERSRFAIVSWPLCVARSLRQRVFNAQHPFTTKGNSVS
jgi:hypothetical protein